MSLTITQSINFEVSEDRKIIFTTARDKRVVQSGFDELFSGRVDVPAGTALYKLQLGGIEESSNLYFKSSKPVKIKPVPVGGSEASTPEYELVPDVPNFIGFKVIEVWVSNPFAESALLTIASVGGNAP